MEKKRLTILFTPLNGWGATNAGIGLGQELLSRGHRVVFAIEQSFKDKFTPFGFEEVYYGSQTEFANQSWSLFMKRIDKYLNEEPLVGALNIMAPGYEKMFAEDKEWDEEYRDIIEKVKPKVIIIDRMVSSPFLTNSGIPWVWFNSNALQNGSLNDERLPPAYSGLPSNGNLQEWQRFTQGWHNRINDLIQEINEFHESKGAPKLIGMSFHPISPYLNVYLWPKEFEFEVKLRGEWIRVEKFIRITNEKFEIPAQLRQRPGKLVFLSMGTIGCGNLELMKRLATILSKSQHRFIVSKGPVFDSYDLPDNMWGQVYLPQTAIIPLVDLVIIHGGNNSLNESFYFGKPMIVMPLFGDQHDNGQRVVETGLGLRLNPFHCSEDELLNAVDRLLADKDLAQRMTAIGERIRKSNDKKVVADGIELIV